MSTARARKIGRKPARVRSASPVTTGMRLARRTSASASTFSDWQGSFSVNGQEPKKDIVRPLFDAGADRVVVRAAHAETEAEMGAQLERMAAAVL
jgi:hypothetical protein